MHRQRTRPLRPLRGRHSATGATVPFGLVERRALLGLVGAALAVSVAIAAADSFAHPGALILEVLLSLAFLPALWSVPVVPVALLAILAASGLVGGEQQALLALAISGGLVARSGSLLVQAFFTVAFVVSVAIVYSLPSSKASASSLVILVLVAAGSAMIGAILRLQVTRGDRVRAALIDEQQRSARIAQDERQRIADDLHDVVAHDLTGIAMHAQLLARTTDGEERRRSEEAILAASRQALTDLRRVVNAASAERADTGALPGYGLAEAIESVRSELTAADYDVRVDVEGVDVGMVSRLSVSTIERILREGSTNVVKHAPGRQRVKIELHRDEGRLRLRLWNSIGEPPRGGGLPSGGYGTVRMQERTQLLGGEFSAARRGDGWLLEAILPVD